MSLQSDRLEYHHLEPFILPPLGFRLLSPRRERRQGCGRVSLSQVDPGLAERETVRLREMRGGCQVALAQQRQHVRGYNSAGVPQRLITF